MFNLPDGYVNAEVEVCLDGEPWSDPAAELSHRYSWWGDGVDYIATLDLSALEPGPHTIKARVSAPSKHDIFVRSAFTIDRPPHRFTLRVADGRSARVILLGEAVVDVDPGLYTLIAVRSVLDDVDVVELEVSGDHALTFAVPQVVEAPGWLTADLHVHTARSGDAFLPTAMRWRSLAAAGLSVSVLTDHDSVTRPLISLATLMKQHGGPEAVQGTEASLYYPDDDGDGNRESLGHMNAFPIYAHDDVKVPSTTLTSLADHLALWRQRQRDDPYMGQREVLLQLNHPRGVHFLDDEAPSSVHNLFDVEGFDVGEPLDWFALTLQGRLITATGNSDSHALASELVGFPVNLVACPAPAPGVALDMDCFVDALQRGRVRVSTGPVVDLDVGGGGPGELSEGSEARVRVQAAPWVPVDELRLVVSGVVVERVELSEAPRGADGVLDHRLTFALPARDGDAWVVAEAGRGLDAALDPEALGVYALIAPKYSPIGFTNPVFIDGDGDGVWTAPGLP